LKPKRQAVKRNKEIKPLMISFFVSANSCTISRYNIIVPRIQLTNTLLSGCSPSMLPTFVAPVKELKKIGLSLCFQKTVFLKKCY
jgi:hypothetical protein